ncbi:MAG: hypothetical protein ABFS08_13470 [Pseudomonadota bacterium]
MKQCLSCGQELVGRQRKYCSRRCKNNYINQSHQSYQAQQRRGRERKIMLIELNGGRCDACGYDRNYSALEFHHAKPEEKVFQLDLRSLSNRKWESILDEAEKCRLLCSNCHAELHNPDCFLKGE